MIESLFNSTTLPMLEQVVQFSQRRHSLLASNIANFDTPGYQVRDLSPDRFESALRDAIQTRNEGDSASLNRVGSRRTDPFRDVSRAAKGVLFHDQSNGDLEYQVAELSKNQTRHNMAVAIMESQFQLLQAAISERV